MLETVFKLIANAVALGCELIAVVLLGCAALEVAFVLLVGAIWPSRKRARKLVWLDFAGWLLLALELTLAADIVKTAIAPTWTDIGQLAAIAVIRTFLNFFLERDWSALSRDTAGFGAGGSEPTQP
jgi:uncharacterized membrane protein